MDKIDAYKEILATLVKHEGILKDDWNVDIADRISSRIKLEEISKEFGISLKGDSNTNWCKLSEYASIGVYGTEHNRTVSWSDDGSQPENERLYVLGFPTGAYVFSQEYPSSTFRSFFDELKGYGAKYTDTNNSVLYFTSDTAQAVHEAFEGIFNKHRALVADELRAERIKSLKGELEKLEA